MGGDGVGAPGRRIAEGIDAAPPLEGGDVERDSEAQRLARMLIQDIVYSDPDRLARARQRGRVLLAYADEIQRAWTFYCRRVGEDVAARTPYFREALQRILAER